jgi:hypothetical protein
MRRTGVVAVAAAAVVGAVAPSVAAAEAEFVPAEVIVKYTGKAPAGKKAAARDVAGVTATVANVRGVGARVVRVRGGVLRAIKRLERTAATVRVRVRRGKRRSIKRAARRGDVKLRARAKTSSGKAARTLRLRASS